MLFTLQSVTEQFYNHHSAIYHLLFDKLKRHEKSGMRMTTPMPIANLPVATRTERRSSITTGVGRSRVVLPCNVTGLPTLMSFLRKQRIFNCSAKLCD